MFPICGVGFYVGHTNDEEQHVPVLYCKPCILYMFKKLYSNDIAIGCFWPIIIISLYKACNL